MLRNRDRIAVLAYKKMTMRSTARTLFFKNSTLLSMARLPSSHSTTNWPNCKMYVSILCIVIALSAYRADGRSFTAESRENNQVILSYTTDTHSRHETGIPGRAVQGFYSYVAGDGRWYKVTYQADERGFRAQTEQLPWPLPVHKPIVNTTLVQVSNSVLEAGPVIENVENVTPKEEVLAIVQKEEIPHQVTITEADDDVLKEPQPLLPILWNRKPAVEIHVPYFTKVYTLKKGSQSDPKRRKTKDGSSRIYRYKLAYLPSYGLW